MANLTSAMRIAPAFAAGAMHDHFLAMPGIAGVVAGRDGAGPGTTVAGSAGGDVHTVTAGVTPHVPRSGPSRHRLTRTPRGTLEVC